MTRSKAGVGPTVMIVDDSELARTLLREILEAGGYRVVAEAVDGADAVANFMATSPDVTVMDLMMPVKNGIQATREILTIDKDARVLLCSSIELKSLTQNAVESGAAGVVFKPLVAEQVLGAVKAVLLQERSP